MADRRGSAEDIRPRLGSAFAAVAMCAVLLAASGLALGIPSLDLAAQVLGGGYPTVQSAIAISSILCYAVVLVAAGLTMAGALRTGAPAWKNRRGLRSATLVLVGAVLFALSLVSRIDAGAGICCGSGAQQVREAVSLAR